MRVHIFFPLLVLVLFAISGPDGWPRGFALFMFLVAAVVVRETGRLLVAAWLGLRLRAILLLPIGGLFAYANPESQETANGGAGQFALALAGPLANWVAAIAAAAAILGASGDVRLFDHPFITPGHLLRSLVWMQAFLGLLHLLPAYPLDCGRLIRNSFARKHGFGPAGTGRCRSGTGACAVWLCWAGILLQDPWLILAGFFIMIGAQIEDQGVFFQSVVDTVRMREVMLTDFATLSPSDTLADALAPLRALAAGGFSCGARTATGGHCFAAADCGRAAQRRQRLCAVGDVARLPGGASPRIRWAPPSGA